MKKGLFLLVAALMAIGQSALAYDFSAISPSGQTLFYKIIDPVNHYVALTYPNDAVVNEASIEWDQWELSAQVLWSPNTIPSGALTIPETVIYSGTTYTVKAIGGSAFRKSGLTALTMPNTIDSVGALAFYGCYSLSFVTYSNTLRVIDHHAFCDCWLGNLVLPSSVRFLGESAYNNAHLASVTLNDSLEVVGYMCFTGNTFSSLYVPASVREFPNPCRYSANNVTSLVVDPANPYLDSRNNCNAVINTLQSRVEQACKTTVLPEGVVFTNGEAFRGCSYDTFSIPTTVRSIAFFDCHIGTLIISSPIFDIEFWGNSIDTIVLLNETPSIISYIGDARYETPVIVPCGSLQAYQSAPVWSNFTNMSELGVPQITVNADEHGSATVVAQPTCGNNTATVNATANANYHFVRWSDGSTQNPYTVTLNGNTTLTAYFAIDSMTVTVTPANPYKGTVIGGGVVPLGGTTTVTAVPTGNNIFLGWSNGVSANPYTLTVTSDTMLQALFTLPDTIVLHDTINHYVHDTTFVNNFVHDTTIQYVNNYVHDTTYIHDYVHDTMIQYVNQYIHDTAYVNNNIHDTLVQYVNNYVHDTIYLNNYVHDTVRMTTQLVDTTIVNIYQFDTAIYNTYTYDTIIVNNHYYDTVIVHVHDTIYITEEGIDGVDAINAKVYSNQGQIVVEGAEGNTVMLYDVTGRVLATRHDNYAPMRFEAPATGTYLIKIGNYPARRVVVIK